MRHLDPFDPAACRHEISDGNPDDPTFAYCIITAGHAGPHHYAQ